MNKILMAALAAVPLASFTAAGAVAHSVEKNGVHSIYPWFEALGCADAAALPTIATVGFEGVSHDGERRHEVDHAVIAKISRALDDIVIPANDVADCPGESAPLVRVGLQRPVVDRAPVPSKINIGDVEKVNIQVTLREPVPIPGLAPQRRSLARVQLARPPISLIWPSREIAEFAATMIVESDAWLPTAESSFDVGLY